MLSTTVSQAQTTSAASEGQTGLAPAAGQAALGRARLSWEKGDYDVAEPLYAEAIEAGGLAPPDVLEAYVHLGAARAVLGKQPGALAAFKAAAVLDAGFTVPPEAGKKAVTLADHARKLEANMGTISLQAVVPAEADPGKPIPVDVTLDAAHASVSGSKLGLYARDGLGGRVHTESVRASSRAHFDLPAELALPSATLRIRVDWLDAHANRLATAEEQLHVHPLTAGSTPLIATTQPREDHELAPAPPHGFWHTAWPYVLGGVALAAGGIATYFAVRPADDVNVTGVRVLTH
jgi:hypothetical protein